MDLYCCEGRDESLNRAKPDPNLFLDHRIIGNMLMTEESYRPSYASIYTVQTDVQPYMRREVATWMLEVCEEQRCEEAVFPLAVNIMDRFLSLACIRKTQLQLLGAACLLIASKARQWRPFTTEQLCYYTDHSVSPCEITSWELLILGRLRWNVSAVLATDYVDYVLQRFPEVRCLNRVRQHSLIFISLCAIEYEFMAYSPSVIAAASLLASMDGLRCHDYPSLDDLAHQLRTILKVDQILLLTCTKEIEELVTSSVHCLQQQQQQQQQNMAAVAGKVVVTSTPSTSNKTSPTSSPDITQPETPTDVQDIYF